MEVYKGRMRLSSRMTVKEKLVGKDYFELLESVWFGFLHYWTTHVLTSSPPGTPLTPIEI